MNQPPSIVGPTCNARLPDGRRCLNAPAIGRDGRPVRSGRCAAHGGLSTGPRTLAGKARASAALLAHLASRFPRPVPPVNAAADETAEATHHHPAPAGASEE